ncbi:glycosyl hydrolase family 28-related protein [Streptomyces scabiei]|uniref:glycosyl hydrolase family 28-related protein n=1 Tax=Streptomyces scabiei TaxID=1930 RepID=UPI0038F5F875
MARHEFGAGIADYVVAPADGLWGVAASAVVTFWDASDAGNQYTDLQDASGTPMTSVKADEFGFLPRFLGPDNIIGMWADAGGTSRAWVEAYNLTAGSSSGPASSLDWLSVRDFGAKGDGVADDAPAIQAAIAAASTAGGGTLYIPAGRYTLGAALNWASNVNAIGAGDRVSILQATNQNLDLISGTDISGVTLQGLQLSGPGRGFGSGVRFTRFAAPSTANITLRDVLIQSMGGDGVFCHELSSSILHRVRVRTCGGVGFHLQAPQDTVLGGASTSLIGCSAEGNVGAAYWLDGMSYTSLTACAAMGSPTGFRLDSCTGVALTGCGAEQCTTGLTVYGGKGATVNGFVTKASDGTSVWLTNSATGVVLVGVTEVSPGSGATTCLRTDAGTIATVLGLTTVKANVLTGTVNRIDPGDGSLVVTGKTVVPSGGTAARMGTATLAAGTVTVNTTAIAAASVVQLTIQTPGGTVGSVYVNARTAGTSFVVKSTSASDTSTVGWRILDPS